MAQVGDNQRVWKTRSWHDNWNNIVRRHIFRDEILLNMMMIPLEERDDIRIFIKKYFIRDAMPDEHVSTEKVRIAYSDLEGAPMNIPQVSRRLMAFDIYVKDEFLHNYDQDRMKWRHQLIAERIKFILTKNRYIENMSFRAVDDFDLGTRTVGYSRYHLVMEYKKTY